jgi:hypothetical protein
VQPKLAVGRVDDPLEREADRVADRVMRMPVPEPSVATTHPQLRRKCAVCEEEESAQMVRTKRAATREGASIEAPSIVHEVLGSPGQPLDARTRAFFEPRFGHDFGRVRIHTDANAAESAEAANALAYTVGEHIAFAESRYEPGSAAGRKLLAHELTHVLQQNEGRLARQAAPPPAPTPQTIIDNANTRRTGVLLFVLSELFDVINAVQLGLKPNPFTFTVQAIQNWLFVSPGDPAFLPSVQAALQLYLRNLDLTPRIVRQPNAVQVDPAGNACPCPPNCPPTLTYSRGGVDPIFICDSFLAAGVGCQRDLLIHEHFHLLGLLLPNVNFPAGQPEPPASNTAQALEHPDSLAQMAAEIADGPHTPCCSSGC